MVGWWIYIDLCWYPCYPQQTDGQFAKCVFKDAKHVLMVNRISEVNDKSALNFYLKCATGGN